VFVGCGMSAQGAVHQFFGGVCTFLC
jgi:hypothetical protein